MKNKITIRISDDLRGNLDELAELEGVSTSEYIRTILEKFCNSSDGFDEQDFIENDPQFNEVDENEINCEEELNSVKNDLYELEDKYEILKTEYDELINEEAKLEEKDIIYSIEFLQLVCWIYYQRTGIRNALSDEQYKIFQDTIIQIHASKLLSYELKSEFNKVLADLVNNEANIFLKYNQLDFSKGTFPKFNYSLLNNFIFKMNCGVKTIII